MNRYSTLTLGEKIYEIRKAKGLSQENMAQALNTNRMTVSRLERGETGCNAMMLAEIKSFLGVEAAPLLEHELKVYRDRIWVWNDLLNASRVADARAMQNEMTVILDLPFEHDLYLLYVVTEVWLLCKEFNFTAAEDRLRFAEGLIDNASNEALVLYHRSKGFLYANARDFKNCLKHSLKALDHVDDEKKPDMSSLHNISTAYMSLGKSYKALICIERIMLHFQGDRTHEAWMHIYSRMAVCYLNIGEYTKAEKMFETVLAQARSLKNEYYMAQALANIGDIRYKTGKYEESIFYCEQSLIYSKQYRDMYVYALATKAYSLLALKEFEKCQEVLEHGKSVLRDKEHGPIRGTTDSNDLTIILEAIGHLMTLDNNESANYVQDIAIPHLRSGGFTKYEALTLCEHIEAHYNKKRTKTKANAIAAIARDIYKEIYEGEDEF